MFIDKNIDYNYLPPRIYTWELVKVLVRTATFAVCFSFLVLFIIGIGVRYGYASESAKVVLEAPDLPKEALVSAHYETLNSREKEAYKRIETALRTMKSGVSLPMRMTNDELTKAYVAVMADNPDIFWVSIRYFSFRDIGPLGVPFVAFSYLYDDPVEVREKHTAYISEVSDLAKQFMEIGLEKGEMPQTDSARCAYDWLAETLEYEHTERDQTVSGAFDEEDGYTVCAGYSKAFKMICDQMGIPCIYVAGRTGKEDDSRHAWNMMVVDGCIYYVDATWGDNGDSASDRWFTPQKDEFHVCHREAFDQKLIENMESKGKLLEDMSNDEVVTTPSATRDISDFDADTRTAINEVKFSIEGLVAN